MRVLVVLFMLSSLSVADELLDTDDVQLLFRKFMQKRLTDEEIGTFKNTLELLKRPEYVSQKSLESGSQARLSLDCIICRSAFGALFQSIRDGQSDEDATDTIVTLCVMLEIESYTVCAGAVALNMPIIAHIIRSEPEATAGTFCGLVLQNAHESACPFVDSRFDWQVELPEKSPIPPPTPKHDSKPLKIAFITDTHIDPLYEPFGVAECDAPTCCRIGQSPARKFTYRSGVDEKLRQKSLVYNNGEMKLNLSVVPEIRKQSKMSKKVMYHSRGDPAPAGFWGDYRNCDTPLWAYDDAIETIHENHKDIDVIYYVGDTIDHGVWETTYELINDMNRYLVQKIRNTFGDHVLVVPALGNHEAQPTNQFAPSRIVGEKLNTTWLYKALEEKWDCYLTEEAKLTFLEQGDFSLLVRPGLRVISLNNNVAYRDNWWLVYDPLDSKKHLDWLVRELHKAELAGEKVHILAHIPPGVHDLIYTWTREYNRIVNRFSQTIAAEFNGHTHSDEFKVFYSPEGTPTNVAWGGGSVTAYTFYNLNYKIATFDTQTFELESMLTYAYNLTEANLSPGRRPHWFLLYDMKNSFGLTDLSAQSIHNLIYSMVTDNRRLLDLYTAFYFKISDNRMQWCSSDDCKIDVLCRAVINVLWERERCEELRKLFFGRQLYRNF